MPDADPLGGSEFCADVPRDRHDCGCCSRTQCDEGRGEQGRWERREVPAAAEPADLKVGLGEEAADEDRGDDCQGQGEDDLRHRAFTNGCAWHSERHEGGGGAPLYGYQGEPETATYVRASAGAMIQLEHLVKPGVRPGDNPYHYLTVRVDGDRMDLEITAVDWGANYRPYSSNRSDLN